MIERSEWWGIKGREGGRAYSGEGNNNMVGGGGVGGRD